ncbi:phage morphogenesis protein [Hoeflea sp. WL0058]|uniref:Phage morphogenesis protein n=1 Tax=Flavimaribacter sediminis TaxID=2865987 RepID=A0AAE2ZQF7_9HYPH|nr:phage morphogenesis protein [Flavimaribacter sediminis]MBW8638995.1 phage morphogenesis protein [Flavimaribacter sediminis]
MPVKWYGRQVSEKMRKAQILGVNATMAACVTGAKRNHPWKNRTGVLEGSIGIAEPASAQSTGGVKGVWGSRDAVQALIQEVGGVIRPVRKQALKFQLEDGTFIVTKKVTIPARPYLRPEADKEYPKLTKRIRRVFESSTATTGGRR